MTEYLKRPSILAGIGGLILAVVAFLLGLMPLFEGKPLTPDKQLEIAIAFIVLWVTHVLIVVLQQIEIAEEVKKLYQQANSSATAGNQKILDTLSDNKKELLDTLSDNKKKFDVTNQQFMEILKIDKEFSHDAWLYNKFKATVKLAKEANKNVFVRKAFEDEVDNFLENINKDLRISYFKRDFPKEREMYRMLRLKRTIESAGQYVYAVTLDGGSYIEEFWSGEFSDEYVMANIDTNSKSPAKIRRAFILDREIVNDASSYRYQLVKKIISDHLRNNIDIHVIFKDNLPASWSGHDTSFLLCDDFVVSESYTLSDEGKAPGYVALKDEIAILKLKKLFLDLINLSPNQLDQISKALGISGNSSGRASN